jgi:hypothetical protein
MRKIETLMNAAITNGRNFRSAILPSLTKMAWQLLLFTATRLLRLVIISSRLFDGGWQSNTTKSRLNAILQVHGIRGEGVFQKNWKWFVHKFIGQAGTSPVFNECDFISGMVLA